MAKQLTRDQFREQTFARDDYTCVFCDQPAVDAHHIIERRLWGSSGGYFIDNGASVCQQHHLECEMTLISVEDVREACGITKIIVPDHLYDTQPYDKWGNPILPNKQRMIGELFFDESVQKILKQGQVLDLFTSLTKYPRTNHVPWSQGIHDDDRVIETMQPFEGQRVIVTTKMDGENTSMYSNYIHARSVDGRSHPSRDWVKQFHSTIAHDIPERWRLCGENLFAKHSIGYDQLPSYFMGFSMWNERNICLSWDETIEWFQLLGVTPVPVLYDGIYNQKLIESLWTDKMWDSVEGYVVRLADEIAYSNFRHHFAKFVRKGHVNTIKHWMHGQRLEKNLLKNKEDDKIE